MYVVYWIAPLHEDSWSINLKQKYMQRNKMVYTKQQNMTELNDKVCILTLFITENATNHIFPKYCTKIT